MSKGSSTSTRVATTLLTRSDLLLNNRVINSGTVDRLNSLINNRLGNIMERLNNVNRLNIGVFRDQSGVKTVNSGLYNSGIARGLELRSGDDDRSTRVAGGITRGRSRGDDVRSSGVKVRSESIGGDLVSESSEVGTEEVRATSTGATASTAGRVHGEGVGALSDAGLGVGAGVYGGVARSARSGNGDLDTGSAVVGLDYGAVTRGGAATGRASTRAGAGAVGVGCDSGGGGGGGGNGGFVARVAGSGARVRAAARRGAATVAAVVDLVNCQSGSAGAGAGASAGGSAGKVHLLVDVGGVVDGDGTAGSGGARSGGARSGGSAGSGACTGVARSGASAGRGASARVARVQDVSGEAEGLLGGSAVARSRAAAVAAEVGNVDGGGSGSASARSMASATSVNNVDGGGTGPAGARANTSTAGEGGDSVKAAIARSRARTRDSGSGHRSGPNLRKSAEGNDGHDEGVADLHLHFDGLL